VHRGDDLDPCARCPRDGELLLAAFEAGRTAVRTVFARAGYQPGLP
jgi:hypothetical protein